MSDARITKIDIFILTASNIGLKDLKEPEETAKTIKAANLIRDLIVYKAIQEMQ